MSNREIVIDNDTLVNLTELDNIVEPSIQNLLRLIFSRIYVPLSVREEYQTRISPERQKILDKLSLDRGFFTLCNRFDAFSYELYKTVKGIDKGEAEVAAQSKKVGTRYVLSDDKKFKEHLGVLDNSVIVFNSLHVIAMLELQRVLSETEMRKVKIGLHSIRPYKSLEIRQAYIDIIKHIGIPASKKQISKLTSLKQIGITVS